MYLNELTVNLMPRYVPNPAFYRCYEETLLQFVENNSVELALRKFEFNLLSAIGYGLQLDYDSENDKAVSPELYYSYHNEKGPVACEPNQSTKDVVSGRTLIALRTWDGVDQGMMREIKRILRGVLSYHLKGKRLYTRNIMRYVQNL
jgi:DNA repair protein RecO (recombination protein O)